MVSKGTKPKSSRIFHLCYLKCCKLQNLTPLTNVIPSGNGKVLDFCVDRIKYADWPPILNALSCDLSLHSIFIKCRQQVKTVLEHVDCERLAKTVNKRCVMLTNFMLSNLMEAAAQLLINSTMLTTLLFEGLPLKIPYLNPISEALLANSSLQHLHLQRCLIGDAGCLAICKAIRCLPNILTLDLTGCEITPLGAEYIAELIKFQKIHRYCENWTHTLRYRTPELDTMAGLRRITLCANPQLGDVGVSKIFDVLADDLWIKALDIQNCGITEKSSAAILQMLTSNKTIVVIDIRTNNVSSESLAEVRSLLRDNDREADRKFTWLASVSGSSSDNSVKPLKSVVPNLRNGISKERTVTNLRAPPPKYVNNKTSTGKKDNSRDYAEVLEEQLQEEISHRQQLEELTVMLVDQNKQLKQQQLRMWGNSEGSSGSGRSIEASVGSGDLSSSSESSSSVPIDQNTLTYIQQACKDIYAFIKNNQCYGLTPNGECNHGALNENVPKQQTSEDVIEVEETPSPYSEELRVDLVSKRPQSSYQVMDKMKVNKITKSAHLLGDSQRVDAVDMKLEMIERQMGDTINTHREEMTTLEESITSAQSKPNKKNILSSPSGSVVSDSDTLVCSPQITQRSVHPALINPRDVLYSSSSEDSS